MLVIRRDQMNALEQVPLRQFEDDLLEHLHVYFPKHWEIVGPESLRHVIRLGLSRAASHGLTTEREIYLYVSLMLYLGSFFDTDVQLPWAGKLLDDKSIEYSIVRIERLYDRAMEFLEQVVGPQGEYYGNALTMAGFGLAGFMEEGKTTPSGSRIIMLLDWIYPRKCQGTLKNRYFRHPADSNPLIIQAQNLRKLYFSRCPSDGRGNRSTASCRTGH